MQTKARNMATVTVSIGAKGWGSERVAPMPVRQKPKVPRNIPKIYWVFLSSMKLIMIRGENCMEANVSVSNRTETANATTVMIAVAMVLKIACATPGSDFDGNNTEGIQAFRNGICSSRCDNTAPAIPSRIAITRGSKKNWPRSEFNL